MPLSAEQAASTDKLPHYSTFEDIQGIFVASIQAALGIHLLRAAGLVTGGTAGTALIISYLTGVSFGLTFFLINIPFYAFAYYSKGLSFALKSLLTVSLVSLLAELISPLLVISEIHPGGAAILFGISAGVGLLGLFRHRGSLGGISIIAVILQDKFGFRAGWTQLIHDLALFFVAAFVFEFSLVLWSLLGALVLNFVIAMNHRRDWYVVS